MTESDRKITQVPPLSAEALAWLSAAADDPPRWRIKYRLTPYAAHTLPIGVTWDAVAMPWPVGTAALQRLREDHAHIGPVVARANIRVVVLLPPGTADQLTGIGCAHSHGSFLAVPGPIRRATDLHWLVPPDDDPTLTAPRDLLKACSALSAPGIPVR